MRRRVKQGVHYDVAKRLISLSWGDLREKVQNFPRYSRLSRRRKYLRIFRMVFRLAT